MKLKIPFFLSFFILLVAIYAHFNILSAQNIGVSTSGATPDPSAMLDVDATTGGFLLPRMTSAERNTIPSPANGLIIYNTTTNYFNVYTPTGWFELSATAYLGNTTGTSSSNFGVAFNTSGTSATSVAICEVSSTTKGLLIPRTTTGAIASPAAGLIIYNITLGEIIGVTGTPAKLADQGAANPTFAASGWR